MAESEEELKSLLMRVKRERAGLKLNIKETKIMTSGPITSWQIEVEKVEVVTDFLILHCYGKELHYSTNGELCSHFSGTLVLAYLHFQLLKSFFFSEIHS